jgi:hypothetical protein
LSIRITKPWSPLTLENAGALSGQLGVYELADADGNVVAIGFAGGQSLFGLRGELLKLAENPPEGATQFRIEVNTIYQTRFRELLMVHVADHGDLPAFNRANPPENLGRLSPL